jgi:hypothetical protein
VVRAGGGGGGGGGGVWCLLRPPPWMPLCPGADHAAHRACIKRAGDGRVAAPGAPRWGAGRPPTSLPKHSTNSLCVALSLAYTNLILSRVTGSRKGDTACTSTRQAPGAVDVWAPGAGWRFGGGGGGGTPPAPPPSRHPGGHQATPPLPARAGSTPRRPSWPARSTLHPGMPGAAGGGGGGGAGGAPSTLHRRTRGPRRSRPGPGTQHSGSAGAGGGQGEGGLGGKVAGAGEGLRARGAGGGGQPRPASTSLYVAQWPAGRAARPRNNSPCRVQQRPAPRPRPCAP